MKASYDIVLLPGIAAGLDHGAVAQRLAQVFGVDVGRILALLASAPTTVRHGADAELAAAFREAIIGAGGTCELRLGRPSEAPAVRPASQPSGLPSRPPPGPAPPRQAVVGAAARSAVEPVFFSPTGSIRWPERCVGCFAEHPEELIPLSVKSSTRGETATMVTATVGETMGALAGGFVGAVVGRLVGGAVSSGLASTMLRYSADYDLPICQGCLSRLEDEARYGLHATGCEVHCSLLSVEHSDDHIILTLRNERFRQAFLLLNPDEVAPTLEAFKAEHEEAGGAEQRPRLERMGGDGLPLEERLVAHLRSCLAVRELKLAPEIPRKLEIAARRYCGVSSSIPVLALLDCTVFGSAKRCLLFTPLGIHFSNGPNAEPARGRVTWQALAERAPLELDEGTIELGGQQVMVAGCVVDATVLVEVIESIRQGLLRPGQPRG